MLPAEVRLEFSSQSTCLLSDCFCISTFSTSWKCTSFGQLVKLRLSSTLLPDWAGVSLSSPKLLWCQCALCLQLVTAVGELLKLALLQENPHNFDDPGGSISDTNDHNAISPMLSKFFTFAGDLDSLAAHMFWLSFLFRATVMSS